MMNDVKRETIAFPQHAMLDDDDLELQPPLPSASSKVLKRDRSVLHPLLCRLFVASSVLKLSSEARFTSLVLLHRYFDASGDEGPTGEWEWIGAACLFLATKTEEESRRLRDVINVMEMLEFGSTQVLIRVKSNPVPLDEEYWSHKEKLVATEQMVLRMLQFDVSVSHPHRAVAVLLSLEQESGQDGLLPICWQYLNQALFYAPALRHDVLTLACAAIECAKKHNNVPRQSNEASTWWLKYGVSCEELRLTKQDLLQSIEYYPINR